MAGAAPPRLLKDDDILLRILEPGHWDSRGATADGFIDEHPEQSFFVAAKKPARDLLRMFANMSGLRNRFNDTTLDETKLYDQHEFRVGWITYRDFKDAGATVVPDAAGNEYNRKGHINTNAKDFAEGLAREAKIPSRADTLR